MGISINCEFNIVMPIPTTNEFNLNTVDKLPTEKSKSEKTAEREIE